MDTIKEIFFSKELKDTKLFAKEIAKKLKPNDILAFIGDLATGKTTLIKEIVKILTQQEATSPTFTYLHLYGTSPIVYHFDLYRLADPGELEYLGIRDLLQSEAILLVEWPEKGTGELPPPDLVIEIGHDGESRKVQIKPHSERGSSLLQRFDLPSWNSRNS